MISHIISVIIMGRPKKLIVKKLLSDEEVEKLEGSFIDENYIKYPLINENIDVYYLDENNQ